MQVKLLVFKCNYSEQITRDVPFFMNRIELSNMERRLHNLDDWSRDSCRLPFPTLRAHRAANSIINAAMSSKTAQEKEDIRVISNLRIQLWVHWLKGKFESL